MVEKYIGVKFDVVFLDEPISDITESIKDKFSELIIIGHQLSSKGYCPLNCGNLSFRHDDGFFITAAGSKLDDLSKDDLVFVKGVDIDSKKIFCVGTKKPSSESMMHSMIYLLREDINVILHAHFLDILCPVTDDEYPYGTLELAKATVKLIRDNDIILLKNHGFISVGKTIDDAYLRIK